MNRGTVVGSLLFGVGWSITGMCPGPILVNIGEGKVYALAALAGALAGAALFGTGVRLVQEAIRIAAIEAAGKGDGLIRGLRTRRATIFIAASQLRQQRASSAALPLFLSEC